MKYLEIIPDFLSMCGVFTTQNTSQNRQEMSNISVYGWLDFNLFSSTGTDLNG